MPQGAIRQANKGKVARGANSSWGRMYSKSVKLVDSECYQYLQFPVQGETERSSTHAILYRRGDVEASSAFLVRLFSTSALRL